MPNNSNSILHKIAHGPRIYKAAGAGAIAVLGLAWIAGGGSSTPAPQPSSAATMPQIAHPPAVVSATPAESAVAASATAVATSTGPLLLPAQPEPAGLMQRHAQIEMAGAPVPGYGVAPTWTTLGRAIAAAPLASFDIAPPPTLKSIAPSSGLLRIRWRAWIHAPATGSYTLVASLAGGTARSVQVRIDGSAAPSLTAQRQCNPFTGCPAHATTAAGTVALAQGWHEVRVDASAPAGSSPPASVTLYARAPGADAPAALVPSWPASAPAHTASAGGP